MCMTLGMNVLDGDLNGLRTGLLIKLVSSVKLPRQGRLITYQRDIVIHKSKQLAEEHT